MFEWLNKDQRKFLSMGYIPDNVTAEDRIRQIADAAEKILNIKGFSDKFYDYMGKGYYSLSSPVWANFGMERGLPISCNGVYIEDSIEQMLDKHGEVSIQTKMGAGTSGYFGDIRPRGTPVSDGSTADGPVHYMRMFETATDVISQGKTRRGAFAAYLNIDHPDIMEFLEIREVGNEIQNMSIGVTVPDYWMQEMIDGDSDKRKIWARVMRKRRESGYPYIFFSDTVNNNKPQVLKDNNFTIYAQNLCLVGDSNITVLEPIVSETGIEMKVQNIQLKDFVEKVNNSTHNYPWKVYSKGGFYDVSAAAKTGDVTTLIKITTANSVVECTSEHLIFTTNRGWVEAQNITIEDTLDNYDMDCLIQSVEKIELDTPVPVYDITVPETESFYANGILVHNCSEIMLPASEEWSFVCNLQSMNLATWDSWKDTDAVEVLTYFLDAVMEEYIQKTRNMKYMEASYNFAVQWRALGIGQLGWHTLLQDKMIAFEDFEAINLATVISKFIDEKSLQASKELAKLYGEPEGMKGYGLRNLTRCAIAPTTSSQFILGQVSPAIEPLAANYFVKDLAKGSYTFKNPKLKEVLNGYGKDTDDTWFSILQYKGSVQHLDFLSEQEKKVFKTFEEISPLSIVQQAAVRQRYIDQGQSLNLMIPHDAPTKDVNSLIIEGWRIGIKTFYYQRSSNPSQELARNIMVCSSCEA